MARPRFDRIPSNTASGGGGSGGSERAVGGGSGAAVGTAQGTGKCENILTLNEVVKLRLHLIILPFIFILFVFLSHSLSLFK